MYEVSLDAPEAREGDLRDAATSLWRLSREEMAKGTLDDLGHRTFTDTKVRKALDGIMRDGPLALVNLIRKRSGDAALTVRQVRESLARIGPALDGGDDAAGGGEPRVLVVGGGKPGRHVLPPEVWKHLNGKPERVVELFTAVDDFCLALTPGPIHRTVVSKTINYASGKKIFCSVHTQNKGLRVWLKLAYADLDGPPPFARDVSRVGHWGVGDLELALSRPDQLDLAGPLIRQSFGGLS